MAVRQIRLRGRVANSADSGGRLAGDIRPGPGAKRGPLGLLARRRQSLDGAVHGDAGPLDRLLLRLEADLKLKRFGLGRLECRRPWYRPESACADPCRPAARSSR